MHPISGLQVLPNTSANAEGDLKKDKDIVLAPNSAIAYNLREINVDKHNGAMQLVLAEHEHGGFKDSVGYDETDAVCGGTSDSAGAGAMNKLILGMWTGKFMIKAQPCWFSWMHVRLVIRRSQVWSPPGQAIFFHRD